MTKRAAVIFVLLVAFAATGTAKESTPIVLYRIMGKIPAVEMLEGDKVGIMLINDGDKKEPSPRFVLAIASSRTVIDTKDLELFKSVLSRLPKGTELIEYDTCTVHRSWGLKGEHYDAYYKVFEDLGLQVSEDTRTICTCDAMTRPVERSSVAEAAPAEDSKIEGDRNAKPESKGRTQ